jgi:hypothetical protein
LGLGMARLELGIRLGLGLGIWFWLGLGWPWLGRMGSFLGLAVLQLQPMARRFVALSQQCSRSVRAVSVPSVGLPKLSRLP